MSERNARFETLDRLAVAFTLILARARDRGFDAGILDLHEDALASEEPRAVHLADGRCSYRFRIELREYGIGRTAMVAFEHLGKFGILHGRHVVAQLGEDLVVEICKFRRNHR